MMKKRILASSMASVMALSSVSVVAFADEKISGESVTKAQLQAYIDEMDKFIDGELEEYGSAQDEKFQNAVDHAKLVLEDSESTKNEYTAAYQMVKAVKAKLEKYSAKDLEKKLSEYKSIYDSENILNEAFEDLIYDEDDYSNFVSAYDDADAMVDSGDTRLITDAYVNLVDAYKDLEENDTVTKAEFRTALRQYEELALSMKNYESWRRGTITVAPTTGEAADNDKLKDGVKYLKQATVTFDQLIKMVYGDGLKVDPALLVDGEWKKVSDKTEDKLKLDISGSSPVSDPVTFLNTKRWIGGAELSVTVDTAAATPSIADYTGLKDAINGQYDKLDEAKGISKTTDKTIVAAYKAAVDAVNVFNGWQADNAKTGSKASASKLMDEYHSDLVYKFNKDVVDAIKGMSISVTFDDDELKTANKGSKLTADKMLYICVKSTTGLADGITSSNADDYIFGNENDAKTSITTNSLTGYEVQKIAAGKDILKYIPVGTIGGTNDGEKGLALYNKYIGYNFNDSNDKSNALTEITKWADGKTVKEAKGSSQEWTIVWRAVKYDLEKLFPAEKAETKYTLAQLKTLYEKAYDLAEETGDAALFAKYHTELVEKRADAVEFYKEAKAKTGYQTGDTLLNTNLAKVYDDLKGAYDNLNKILADYPYTYQEIRMDIAKIAIAIDAGEVKGDDLTKALQDCAYALSVVEASDAINSGDAEDNQAFDSSREFQIFNRLKTQKTKANAKQNDSEKELTKTYKALVEAYDAAKNADKGVENDFDGDGAFNVKDVDALIDALLDGKTDSKYDVDGNGTFNVKDVDALIDVLLA